MVDILEQEEFNNYKYLKENYKNILNMFRHSFEDDVKFSQVDSFNVVHNLSYLYWLEWARTDYLFTIGLPKTNDLFQKSFPLMTVNSQIDYFKSLTFPEKYKVLTKITKIGKSSIKFYNLIINENSELILKAVSTLVYVNKINSKSIELPEILIQKINDFENFL